MRLPRWIARLPSLVAAARCRLAPRAMARRVLLLAGALACLHAAAEEARAPAVVPILAYHRFAAPGTDGTPEHADYMTRHMNVPPELFAAQLLYLREHGYTVVPLRHIVDALQGRGPRLPDKPVAITVDDGHRTVYTELLPIVERERIPVTVFIYPSAISNADWAMTWQELARLRDSGLFDIQSHTYWHPDFRVEKKRLAPDEYQRFVRNQLEKSRSEIRRRLSVAGAPVEADMLSWTFGICDDELTAAAHGAGYVAAFTLDTRHARSGDNPLALPRHIMFDTYRPERFARLLESGAGLPADGKAGGTR